jgi:hypothetical protein
MRKITCDICGEECCAHEVISFMLKDGEHPHNGSTMWKTVDTCAECAHKLTEKKAPQVYLEYDDVRKDFA